MASNVRPRQYFKFAKTQTAVNSRQGIQYKVDTGDIAEMNRKINTYRSYFYIVSGPKSLKFGISEHPSTGAPRSNPARVYSWLRLLQTDGRVHGIYGFSGKKSAYAFESYVKSLLKERHPDIQIDGAEYIPRAVVDPGNEPGDIDEYQRGPVGAEPGTLTKFLDIIHEARAAWDTTEPLRDMYKDIEGMRVSEQPDEATGLYYRIPSERIELLEARRARMQTASGGGGGGGNKKARMPDTIRPAVRARAVKIQKTAAIHTPSRISRNVKPAFSTRGLRRSRRVQSMVTRTENRIRTRR